MDSEQPSKLKKWTLSYLAFYLLSGGIGFFFIPSLTLKLFLSNGNYGDVMPRLVGLFMLLLGSLIAQFVIRKDYNYYGFSIVARTFAVCAAAFMWFYSKDSLFITLMIIILIGLLPSYYAYFKEKDN